MLLLSCVPVRPYDAITFSSAPLLPLTFPKHGSNKTWGPVKILIIFFFYFGKQSSSGRWEGPVGAKRGPGSLQHIGILCEIEEARCLHWFSHSRKEQEIHLGTANLCLEMFQQKLWPVLLWGAWQILPFTFLSQNGKVSGDCYDNFRGSWLQLSVLLGTCLNV